MTRRKVGLVLGAMLVALPAVAQPPPWPPLPPPRYEVMPPAPGAHLAWQPGHWHWDGRGYVWIGGRWIERANAGVEWVPGHWAPRGGGWIWVAPHWR